MNQILRKLSDHLIISSLGKIFGFLRYIVLLRLYGADVAVDIVIFLLSLVWLWSNTIVTSLFAIRLIPHLSEADSREDQLSVLWRVFSGVNVATVAVISVVLLFPDKIVGLFSGSEEIAFIENTTRALFLITPLLVLVPMTEFMGLYNQWRGNFRAAAANLAIWNSIQVVGLVGLYLLIKDNSADLVAIAFLSLLLIGYLFSSLMQIYWSDISFSQFPAIAFSFSPANASMVIRRNFKLLLGVLFLQLGVYIDNYYLLSMESGSLAAYTGITRFSDIFQSLVGASLGAVVINRVSIDHQVGWKWWLKIWSICIGLGASFSILCYLFGVELMFYFFGDSVSALLTRDSVQGVLVVVAVAACLYVAVLLISKVFIVRNMDLALIFASTAGLIMKFSLISQWSVTFGLFGVAMASVLSVATVLILLVGYLFYRDTVGG